MRHIFALTPNLNKDNLCLCFIPFGSSVVKLNVCLYCNPVWVQSFRICCIHVHCFGMFGFVTFITLTARFERKHSTWAKNVI